MNGTPDGRPMIHRAERRTSVHRGAHVIGTLYRIVKVMGYPHDSPCASHHAGVNHRDSAMHGVRDHHGGFRESCKTCRPERFRDNQGIALRARRKTIRASASAGTNINN